jgi:hypothetical protein
MMKRLFNLQYWLSPIGIASIVTAVGAVWLLIDDATGASLQKSFIAWVLMLLGVGFIVGHTVAQRKP